MYFIVFMGYMMSAHFLPNNYLGTLLSGLLFVAICGSSYLIEHEGMLHYGHTEED